MNRCNSCGVELEEGVSVCPLCGGHITDETRHRQGPESDDNHADEGERRRARTWLWEMFTIVVVAISIIVAASDFAYGFDLSWSVFPLTALAFVWVFVSLIIFLAWAAPVAYGGATLSLVAYLFVLDLLIPGPEWFLPLALPITLLVSVVAAVASVLIHFLKFSVFQTLAAAVFFVGVFVLGLEVVLYFALDLESILSWSIVGFGGCLSIALLLWIINRRLRERHADFKRVFHL